MAHSKAKLTKARAAYIMDNLNLEQIAALHKVPLGTLRNWKRKAKKEGDDWEKARAANFMAGEGIESVQKQMLADFVRQHQSIMLNVYKEENAELQTKMLASLADSYNKITAACRRVLPETDKLSVAMQTLHLLSEFVMQEFPQHGQTLLEILEPFGEELSKKLG